MQGQLDFFFSMLKIYIGQEIRIMIQVGLGKTVAMIDLLDSKFGLH